MSLLSPQTQKVVSLLQGVTDSVIFSYPVTGVRDAFKTVYCFLDFQKFENEEFEEFGIIKLKELLDVIKVVGDDANLSMGDNRVIYINGKGAKCRYLSTPVSSLESSFRAKPVVLNNIKASPVVCSFNFSSSDQDRLRKISALLNFEDAIITSNQEQNKISIVTSTGSTSNNFSMDIEGENVFSVDETRETVLNISSLKKVPLTDYRATIRRHPADPNTCIIQLEATQIEGLTFILAQKAQTSSGVK